MIFGFIVVIDVVIWYGVGVMFIINVIVFYFVKFGIVFYKVIEIGIFVYVWYIG